MSSVCVLICAVAGVRPLLAAELTIADYFRTQRVTELAISPDGRAMVYAVRQGLVPVDEATPGSPERRVYLQGATSSAKPALLNGLAGATALAWTPGSREISYLCEQPGGDQVCSYDTATGHVVRLTQSPEPVQRFSFAPDGKTLAYMTRPPVTPGESLYDRFRNDGPGVVINSNRLSVYEFVNPARGSQERPPPAALWIRNAAGEVRKVPVPGEVGGPAGSFFWSSDASALSVTYVSNDLPDSLLGAYSRTSVGVFDHGSGEFRVIAKATEPTQSEAGLTFRGGEWFPQERRFMIRRVTETDPWVSPQFPEWTIASVAAGLSKSAWHAIEESSSSTQFVPRNA